MNIKRALFLFGFGIVISTSAHAQVEFSRVLTECATSFNVDINRGVSRSIENSVSGDAQLDLYTFMKVFPEKDRLDAYKVFSQCLVKRYKTSEAGAIIHIGEPKPIPSIFPDLTNKYIELGDTLDVNGKKEVKVPFSIRTRCQLVINFGRHMGFSHHYRLSTKRGSRIASSNLGTNHGPDRVRLGPGKYYFSLIANRGAGYFEAKIEAQC